MKIGIQLKITVFLVLALVLAFGLTGSIFTFQASRLLNDAARDKSTMLFRGLEEGQHLLMKRGEMDDYRTLISSLGKLTGVEEIGLSDAEGVVKISNRADTSGQPLQPTVFKAAVGANGQVRAMETGTSLFRFRAIYLEADCLSCHDKGKAGDLSGVLFARYDQTPLAKARSKSILTGIATGLGGLIAASLGVYFLAGVLVRVPLRRLTSRMEEMATGNADLKQRLPVGSKDEMGELAQAFNAFVENLRVLVSQVLFTTREVSEESDQILAASLNMLSQATTQSDRTQSAATAAEEMSSAVLDVSRSAHDAAEAARLASDSAADGGQTVREAVSGMVRVEDSVRVIASKVRALGGRSHSIVELMQVIDDIADQTNLLALNAAIEAARAGEHGRGFAVVADEVRKLAEKTAKATQQVRETTVAIRDETEQAVDLVEVGLNEAAQSGAKSQQAGESLEQIVARIEKNSELVTQIATATEQQSEAVSEVSENLDFIALLSREVATGAEQTKTAAERLRSKARALSDLVGTFGV